MSGESGGTIVQFNSGSTSVMNINGLVVDQIHFTGTGNTINGNTPLGINGSNLVSNILDDVDGNTLSASLPLVLSGLTCGVNVTAGTLNLAGNVSGAEGLVKTGAGTLTVTSPSNTYSGMTSVEAGVMALNSIGSSTAIPHDLVIGLGTGNTVGATVRLLQPSEISDGSNITIKSDGLLDLNNFNEVVNTVTMTGGSVTLGTASLFTSGLLSMTDGSITGTGPGSVALGGDISGTSTVSGGGAKITCNVSLNGNRTFTANSGGVQPELTIFGTLSDGTTSSGFKKSGTGTLKLLSTVSIAGNTFTGTATVDKGTLQMNASQGAIIPGALVIGNSVDAAFSATVQELQSSDISSVSAVTLNSSGALDLNNFSDVIGALTGTGGTITLGSSGTGQLSAGSGNVTSIFGGFISGQGSFRKTGTGTLTITGNNNFVGTFYVDDGTVALNSNGINTAIQQSLVIGNGTGAAKSAVVQLLQGAEIADSSTILINADGLFDLNGQIDQTGAVTINGGNVTIESGLFTAAGLNLTGGTITGTTGELSLAGDITATSSAAAGSSIAATVHLNGNRTLTVNPGAIQPELTIDGVIGDGSAASGILKNGTGTLFLEGSVSNTYTGTTTVDKGTLTMNTSVGVIVPGALVIGNGSDPANSAVVRDLNSSDIASTAAVTINVSGVLDLNNHSDTIGALNGTGSITLGSGTLVVGSDSSSSEFDGPISGASGSLFKSGSGTLTLTQTNTYTGQTTVSGGTLLINGAQAASAVSVLNGATLGGTGTVGAVTVTASRLSPGGGAGGGVGKLSTGNLALDAASTIIFGIPSTAAGAFDSLAVTGTVNLGGCAVQFNPAASLPSPAGVLRLIDNDAFDAVTGIFSGKPAGTKIFLNVVHYVITYTGGTGNDVELQLTNVPPMIVSQASAGPNPAGVGQSVAFLVSASDADNDPLTYAWNFGDGASGSGASVTHAYTAVSHYPASVIVDDGNGGTATSSVMVAVNAPIVGFGSDSDGDGFSDGFETEVGTNPNDAASTPLNGLSASAVPNNPLNLSKASVKLNFAAAGKDAISFAGALAIPANFAVSGQRVTLDFGGIARSFPLNSKGMAKGSDYVFKLSVKASKGVVLAQSAKFTAALSKGGFAAALADEGLTGAATVTKVPRTIYIVVLAGDNIFQTSRVFSYTAKMGKTGAAK